MKRYYRKFTNIFYRLLSNSNLSQKAQVGTRNLVERELWLEEALKRIPTGSRILDAGAGELQYKKFCGHLNYVNQDFAQYNGSGDGVGLQTKVWDQTRLDIISDITSIPEPDGSFDAIMCIEVLEHIPYPVDALHELVRLLRPGGYLVVTAPFVSLTHFSPYFYQQWLQAFGFEILDLNENGNLNPLLGERDFSTTNWW